MLLRLLFFLTVVLASTFAFAKLEDDIHPDKRRNSACLTELASLYTKISGVTDSRQEIDRSPRCIREIAQAAVTLIPKKNMKRNSTSCSYQVHGKSLRQDKNLCKGERFGEQTVAGECSGTLISPNEVLTAGHCLEAGEGKKEMQEACDNYYVVFNYTNSERPIPCDQVYECAAVESSISDDTSNTHDAAKIRLNNVVADHQPAVLAQSRTPLPEGTPLIVIGSPNGIPLKAARGSIKAVEKDKVAYGYRTNLDTFAGNSGSGIYNALTGELIGFLWDGEDDYEKVGDCMRAKVYKKELFKDRTRGEYVTPLSALPISLWPGTTARISAGQTLEGGR